LTLNEFLVLYLTSSKVDINKEIESLVNKGVASRDLFSEGNLIFGSKDKDLVTKIIVDSDKEVQDNTLRLNELAKSLQELYPQGKKEGTQYYWRDSTSVIEKKLKTLVKKYGNCFTNEQAIAATKKYVDSFNGNYHFMQLLKYFISKNVIKGGEVEEQSQLLSYIENMNQADTQQLSIDWDVELR
jgi:hypothetical protein